MRNILLAIAMFAASAAGNAQQSPVSCIEYPGGGFECTNAETGRSTFCYPEMAGLTCESYRDGLPEPGSRFEGLATGKGLKDMARKAGEVQR